MKLLNAEQAAALLSLKPKSLRDKRFRTRLGLSAIKLAGRIAFDERDIAKLIDRSREKLPAQSS